MGELVRRVVREVAPLREPHRGWPRWYLMTDRGAVLAEYMSFDLAAQGLNGWLSTGGEPAGVYEQASEEPGVSFDLVAHS